jgi:hypothetical protein
MSPKHCPHCQKRIPLRKRFRARCPFCFKTFRRRSGIADRSLVGQWLEDRTVTFWFFLLVVVLGILAVAMQLGGNADLLNLIDSRPFWFAVSIWYLSIFAAHIGRIYFPLLAGAPRILRRERSAIRGYRTATAIGLVSGVGLALLFVGFHGVWSIFPATAFLLMVPVALMWAYQGLTLTEEDYDDERTWTFLQEIGAADRLEHRHHALMTLVMIPLAGLLFYYFMTHHWLARMIMESEEHGLIAMFKELARRATGRGAG